MPSNSRTSSGNGSAKPPGPVVPPERLYLPIIIIGTIGVFGLLLAALAIDEPSKAPRMTSLSVGILVTTASCLVGGGLGFLFALPRDLSRQQGVEAVTREKPPNAGELSEAASEAQRTGWANNNLIKVSDWLTTLIVGVTLVQFGEIRNWLGTVGKHVGNAAGLKGESAQLTFGVTIIVAGFLFGFLTGYVQTRTTVTRRLAVAARDVEEALRQEIDATARSVESIRNDLKNAKTATANQQRRFEASASIMLSLYRPAPYGFRDAIMEANRLMRSDPMYREDAKIWAYLACAYGQQYAHELRENEPDPGVLKKAADDAYDAIQNCLNIDPDQKHWLQTFWNPEDPGHLVSDSYLTPFYDDTSLRERFSRLLG